MDILWPKMLEYIYFSKGFHAISYIVLKRHAPLPRFPETFSMWCRSIFGTKWHRFDYCCNLWWVQPLYCINTLDYYQTCIWNIHIISCDLCHCKHLVTHVDLMISIKRFSIHMFVSHPYPNPAHSKEQWCHGFVNSLSPKHKDIYGLTLSQVNPRPQRGIHNFNITDDMIYWIDQNLHMWNVFH